MPRCSFVPFLSRAVSGVALGLLSMTLPACDKADTPPPAASTTEAVSDVMRALTDRTSHLTSVEVEGVYRPKKEGGLVQHYTYIQRFPNLVRVDVKETQAHFLFDGTVLTLIKDDTKTVTQQQLGAADPAQAALLMRNYFGTFLTEGWRMPLISPTTATAQYTAPTGQAPEWKISMAVPGTDVAHHYRMRAPKADFLGAETKNAQGDVLKFTKILDEYVDPDSKLSYPKKWELKSNVEHAEIELTSIKLNHDIDKNRFTASWPDDYTVRMAK